MSMYWLENTNCLLVRKYITLWYFVYFIQCNYLILWHHKVCGLQLPWPNHLYDSAEDKHIAQGHSITCGKWGESGTIIFPLVADSSVMTSMPHLLKRGTAVSREDHSQTAYPELCHKVKTSVWLMRHVKALNWPCPQVFWLYILCIPIIPFSYSPFWHALGYLM